MIKDNNIEFDIEELAPLLIANKTEGFRQIGEKILNAILVKEFETFIGARVDMSVMKRERITVTDTRNAS